MGTKCKTRLCYWRLQRVAARQTPAHSQKGRFWDLGRIHRWSDKGLALQVSCRIESPSWLFDGEGRSFRSPLGDSITHRVDRLGPEALLELCGLDENPGRQELHKLAT